MPLPDRLTTLLRRYPRQFWLMFAGMLISTIGSSMIWPFLTLYASSKLDLPLAAIGGLFTIISVAGIASAFLAGPLIDRFGRKWMMVTGLALNGLVYLALNAADSLAAFSIVLAFFGAVGPLYRVAADAMLADLVPPEQRADAYALMRWSANLGIAIGPLIGGVIASTSYSLAFILAAAGMIAYSLLLLFFAHETMPAPQLMSAEPAQEKQRLGGFGPVFRDWGYIRFLLLITLGLAPGILIWTLMPVYANEYYGVSEKLYGLIPTTNALMVVTLQIYITRIAKRYPSLPVIALGTALYGLGAGMVALAGGFFGFWLSMVVMTLGELTLVPTSSSYVANHAPADMRGRYMSLYNLTWSVAAGFAPVFGGLLNDLIAPWATWVGGLALGLSSAALLMMIYRRGTPATVNELGRP